MRSMRRCRRTRPILNPQIPTPGTICLRAERADLPPSGVVVDRRRWCSCRDGDNPEATRGGRVSGMWRLVLPVLVAALLGGGCGQMAHPRRADLSRKAPARPSSKGTGLLLGEPPTDLLPRPAATYPDPQAGGLPVGDYRLVVVSGHRHEQCSSSQRPCSARQRRSRHDAPDATVVMLYQRAFGPC
jgi:hypothetical protein